MNITKFERARRQAIQYWKDILCDEWCIDNRDCGFCYYYKRGAIALGERSGTAVACSQCPVKIACRTINTQGVHNGSVNRAMAILLWLMSDDCKSLDDGSM